MSTYTKSIGREKAVKMYESEWWKDKSYRQIAKVQLFTTELTCPFDVFHEALEKSLGRSVFTHEMGLNYDGLVQEFLDERDAPTEQEIMDLIPPEKLVVVRLPEAV